MACIPPATLFENALFAGINVQDILYGIELVLYFKTMRVFLARRRKPHKYDAFYAIFSSVMLLLITLWISAYAIFGQKMWILDRNYPGGPMAYTFARRTDMYMVVGITAPLILQSMTDGLMIYRCRIVWASYRVIIIPCILWSVNLVLLILMTWAANRPGKNNYWTGLGALFGLVFYTVAVFLNTILTVMICYRLLRHAKGIKECLGEDIASPYFSIITLVIESALPYTLAGIPFLVSYGMMSQAGMFFSCVYMLMMCISPQMLILRVAEGSAWQKGTIKAPTSVIRSLRCSGDVSGPSYPDNVEMAVMHLETLRNIYHLESVEDFD